MAYVVENADTRFESPSVPYFWDVRHDSSGVTHTGLADGQTRGCPGSPVRQGGKDA